jgi:hypothetical protein
MTPLDIDRPSLLDELRELETELHQNETRYNRKRMEALLHPEFLEFGRSGRGYTRAEVLEEFGPGNQLSAIHSGQFGLILLAEHVALLTYVSAHKDAKGVLYRHSLRSSVWVHTKVGWQLRFHQGTPITEGAELA